MIGNFLLRCGVQHHVKYWSFLVLKLAAALVVFALGWVVFRAWYPRPAPFLRAHLEPFGRDLTFTFLALFYWLICTGIVWLIWLDHRFRCRACLRRLIMPVSSGRWDMVLFRPPHTDYICPFGHGTLRVGKSDAPGAGDVGWEPISDMWEELRHLEESRK